MDLNTTFLTNHSEHFIESRRASASHYAYGNGSLATGMIAALAAGVRRGAATIERWARGTAAESAEIRLPRMNSAR